MYEQSYEDLTFHVIRADDKVISLSWGLEGYDAGAQVVYFVLYELLYADRRENYILTVWGADSATKHWNW